ncbi:hypothetical protein BH10BDE1_BH10BDE1_26900 [soil metagenome]
MRVRSILLVASIFGSIFGSILADAAFGATKIDAKRSRLTIKNTATENASLVISYPVERNESGISLEDTVKTIGEIALLNTGSREFLATDFAWDFDWSKPWLGAGSQRREASLTETSKPVFSIMLWGGFIRATGMTLPALEFTICHEFGHFLGGDPHQIFSDEIIHWSSAEGQADWWAATVCLPKLYRSRGMSNADATLRIRQSGQDFAHFANIQFERGSIAAGLENRATETPAATLTLAYPTTQCRLDTIADGATCAFASPMQQPKACTRPRCWFAP